MRPLLASLRAVWRGRSGSGVGVHSWFRIHDEDAGDDGPQTPLIHEHKAATSGRTGAAGGVKPDQHDAGPIFRPLGAFGWELASGSSSASTFDAAALYETFHCGICLSDESDGATVRATVECGHTFCNTCLCEYVRHNIADSIFPMRCPTCAVDKDVSYPGFINSFFAEQLGLFREEIDRFIELELSAISVLVHCRVCDGRAYVGREEYQAMEIIMCPIPGCQHIWCKICSQTIDPEARVVHSCDGRAELDDLMEQQGWKYCPGCRTPVEKNGGCNHMTCKSPCNIHFCYLCGKVLGNHQADAPAHLERCSGH